jgi:heme-degrading monooxygenase HmoA
MGSPPEQVTEIADIQVVAGAEADFVAAYQDVRQVLLSTPGCRSARMTQCIETPTRFVLLVEWDSVEAHERNFRETERFTQWRAAIGAHFAVPPHVEHFVDLDGDTETTRSDVLTPR